MKNVNENLFSAGVIQHSYSLADFGLGEEAIVSAPAFRENRLRLYADVPLRDLTSGCPPEIWSADCREVRIDYLICKDACAVMAIQVTDPERKSTLPLHIPFLTCVKISSWRMEQGLADNLLDRLDELLYAGFRPAWSYQPRSSPRSPGIFSPGASRRTP